MYSDEGYRIMPIYQGGNKAVKDKWSAIIANARKYKWAEQQGFAAGPTFKQWPRSLYLAFGTNSNTFVREMTRLVGLSFTDMSGLHPGDDRPKQNTLLNDIYGFDT